MTAHLKNNNIKTSVNSNNKPRLKEPVGISYPVNNTQSSSNNEAKNQKRINDLCHKFSYLPQSIAKRLSQTLPNHVDFDDLIGAGGLGLVHSLRQHHAKPDIEFKRLAKSRVRGAMLDYLRDIDPLSRRQRAAVSAYQKAKKEALQLGQNADLESLATKMGISIERAELVANQLANITINAMKEGENYASNDESPMNYTLLKEKIFKMRACLNKLDDRAKALMLLHYEQELTYKQIGEKLGISRSRICQIHNKAIGQLKKLWEEQNEINNNISAA